MRTALSVICYSKNIRVIIGIIMCMPVIANGKIPVHFLPHDYDGFKTASNPKAKKRAANNRICKAPLVGLDLARSYAGGKKCLKNIQPPSGLLSNKVDYVILVDDTQKMSSYLTSLLADQKLLRSVNGRQIISPTLLEFKGRESNLKVLVVGESHFQNLTGTNKEKKWFTTLDVIETHIFPALKELTNQSSPVEFGFRGEPLKVSSGLRELAFKANYHECAREMVSYVKQREFGLVKIGGPAKRCQWRINKKNKPFAQKLQHHINDKHEYSGNGDRYNRFEWYKVTNETCKVEKSDLADLRLFENTDWYRRNPGLYDGKPSSHAPGRGIDYFTRDGDSDAAPTENELNNGNKFRDWVLSNAIKYNVKNVIWNKEIFTYRTLSAGVPDWIANPYTSGDHFNHVHVEHNKTCN